MLLYLKKIAALGFLLFMLLWIVGVIRGFTLEYPPPPLALETLSLSSGREYVLPFNGNFAHNLKQIGLIQTPLPLVLDNPEVEVRRGAGIGARRGDVCQRSRAAAEVGVIL
jgi:hypothetical protein